MKNKDGQPKLGSAGSELGVRVPKAVKPDTDGVVLPRGRGMSVAPSIESLSVVFVPKRLRTRFPSARGRNSLRVWELGEGPFNEARVTDALTFQPTSPSHGVIRPSSKMHIDEFQKALAATRGFWKDGEQR